METDGPSPALTPARKRAIAIAAAALAAAVAGVLLVVAHGGHAGTGTAAGPGGAAPFAAGGYGFARPGGTNGGFDSFRQCLEKNGVTVPDPSQGRPNLDDSTTRKAFEACRQYLPLRGSGNGRGFGGAPRPATPPSQDDGTTTTDGSAT